MSGPRCEYDAIAAWLQEQGVDCGKVSLPELRAKMEGYPGALPEPWPGWRCLFAAVRRRGDDAFRVRAWYDRAEEYLAERRLSVRDTTAGDILEMARVLGPHPRGVTEAVIRRALKAREA